MRAVYICEGCDHEHDSPELITTCKICNDEYCSWCNKEMSEESICEECGKAIDLLSERLSSVGTMTIHDVLIALYGVDPYKI